MIFVIVIVNIFLAFVWVNYFKSISVFKKLGYVYLIIPIFFGVFSAIPLSFFSDYIPNFKIAKVVIEEFSKLLLFVLYFYIFRSRFHEISDYIISIALVALGFATFENIIHINAEFSINQNKLILIKRIVLTPICHMVYSVLILYGFMKYKFQSRNKKILIRFLLFSLLCHFIYNLLVDAQIQKYLDIGLKPFLGIADTEIFHISWSMILYMVCFFLIVSIFINILNNALNNSNVFSYKIVINPDKILLPQLFFYSLIFVVQIIIFVLFTPDLFAKNPYVNKPAQVELVKSFFIMFIFYYMVLIMLMRISRFKFLHKRWKKIKLEFPFMLFKNEHILKIKGDTNDEAVICSYFEEYFELHPVFAGRTFLKNKKKAFLEKKILDQYDQSYFLIRVYKNKSSEDFKYFIMKSKKVGKIKTLESFPIVILNEVENVNDLVNIDVNINELKILDYAYVKPKLIS